MKAAVALALTISLLGCFPNNARHRRYAQYGEGAALVAGIIISAMANTGADCDSGKMIPGVMDDNCKSTAKWLSTAGVVLIVGGLLGFVATVSTAQDDADSTPRVLSSEPGGGSAAGSAAPAPAEPAPAPTTEPAPAPAADATGSAATPATP